jgi:hypothetical protein
MLAPGGTVDSPQFNQQPGRIHIEYKFRSGRQQAGRQSSYAHVGISSRKNERKKFLQMRNGKFIGFPWTR